MDELVSIEELIKKGGILYDVPGETPSEIYKAISESGKLPDNLSPELFYKELMERENLMSTGVGNGISIPHARFPLLKDAESERIIVCFPKSKIYINAPDLKPVFVMFVILSGSSKTHLKILSNLAFLFRNAEFRACLEKKPSEEELLSEVKKLLVN